MKTSPQNIFSKSAHSAFDAPDNFKLSETNILELLRETDTCNKTNHVRSDSPVTKVFLSPPYCSQRDFNNTSLSGCRSTPSGRKSPINGLTYDVFVKSSSGSDLTSMNHTESTDSDEETGIRKHETEKLLVRHYSVGHRPTCKSEFTLSTERDHYTIEMNGVDPQASDEAKVTTSNM